MKTGSYRLQIVGSMKELNLRYYTYIQINHSYPYIKRTSHKYLLMPVFSNRPSSEAAGLGLRVICPAQAAQCTLPLVQRRVLPHSVPRRTPHVHPGWRQCQGQD